MSSLCSQFRTAIAFAFAFAVLALGANIGITSASAKMRVAGTSKTHHVHKARHRHTKKSHRRHTKKVRRVKKVVAKAANATPASQPAPIAPWSSAAPSNTTAPTDPTTSNGTPLPAGISGDWNLVLNSQFNGSSLPAPWHTGWFGPGVTGPANPDEQDCYSPSNVTFPGDGAMHLNVTQTTSECQSDGSKLSEPYTGSMVTTDPSDWYGSGFQYTYGVVEALVYVPGSANGEIADWPAVWAGSQNWPMTGEDDLMEGLGGQGCYHFHYGSSASAPQAEGGCDVSLTPGWHTFASDWQAGSVTYYYDGQLVGSLTQNITSAPMYLMLDNTVSSVYGGPTQADSMEIKYVRIWQQS